MFPRSKRWVAESATTPGPMDYNVDDAFAKLDSKGAKPIIGKSRRFADSDGGAGAGAKLLRTQSTTSLLDYDTIGKASVTETVEQRLKRIARKAFTEVKRAHAELDDVRAARAADIASATAEANDKVAHMTQALTDAQAQLKAAQDTAATETAQFQARIRSLEDLVVGLQGDLAASQAQAQATRDQLVAASAAHKQATDAAASRHAEEMEEATMAHQRALERQAKKAASAAEATAAHAEQQRQKAQADADAALQEMARRYKAAEAALTVQKDATRSAEEAARAAGAELVAVKDQFVGTLATLKDVEADAAANVQAVNQRCMRLKEELTSAHATTEAMEHRSESLRQDAARNSARVSELEAEVQQLSKDLSRTAMERDAQVGRVAAIDAAACQQRAALEAQVRDLSERVESEDVVARLRAGGDGTELKAALERVAELERSEAAAREDMLRMAAEQGQKLSGTRRIQYLTALKQENVTLRSQLTKAQARLQRVAAHAKARGSKGMLDCSVLAALDTTKENEADRSMVLTSL